MKKDYLYILSNGRVAAINKKDGSIIWEVRLKTYLSSKMTINFGHIAVEGDKIYVGGAGVLVCLQAKDGALVWKNELKGWGYNFVSMANTGNEAAAASAQAAAMAATIAATTAAAS